MNRKLLTKSLYLLPIFVIAASGACSTDSGTDYGTAGKATGGSAGSAPVAGSAPTAGSSTVGGGGAGQGGKGPTAGSGGMTPTAGSGGSGGSGGSAGSGGSGPITPEIFAGTKNEHGFAWLSSFYLVACTEVQQHDCLTVQGACPNQGADNFEDKGSTFAEQFKMGGEAGKMYSVTIKVNGIVEGKYYQGGMRRDGANYDDANSATGGDAWHVGGSPIESSYNVYKLSVFQPDGTTPVQHYYLNSYPQMSGFESHQTVAIGYEATFDVPGQGVIKYLNQDSNCRAINNCGPGDNGANCPAARPVPNEPGLAVPATYGSKPVNASFNVVNQAQQPFHAQMVHVTVAKVELKP